MTATIFSSLNPPTVMLEARALTCVRGERLLFSNLELSLSSGQCLHVRGENGVGKTSLLRLLTGLAKPEAGEIFFSGKSIYSDGDSYRRNLLFLGHHDALKEDLTALENVLVYAALDDVNVSAETALATLWRFGLRAREDLPVQYLSAGQKKRVLMARMVTKGAKVWILDEPFNALDTSAAQVLQDLIVEQVGNGGLVILTSHQALAIPNLRVLDL